jgi:hypothetical protein
MRQMSVAGLSCRDFIMRIAVVLVLSASILGAMADPFAQLVVATDADDAGHAEFAADDRGVAGGATRLGHDRRRPTEQRHPVR